MTRFFLDTTVQIERVAGGRPVKKKIADLLAGETHATSSHVRREWKHVIDGSCAAVLNALADSSDASHAPDLGDLFARLGQGYGRAANSRLRVLSLLSAGSTEAQIGDIKTRAKAMIRYQSEVLFVDKIDTVRDGSECGLATNEVVKNLVVGRYELVDRCTRDQDICRQPAEIESKLTRFAAVGTALAAVSKYQRLGKTVREAAASALLRKGKNCYSVLGDVSIALDCADEEVLLTTDESYDVICPAIGITHTRISATPQP